MKRKSESKPVMVQGWSCWPLMVDRGWNTAQVICLKDGTAEELNEHQVRFCGDRRHGMCVRQRGCDACWPRCTYDENELLGHMPASCREVTARDRRRIARILKRHLSQCRRISITVEEIAK